MSLQADIDTSINEINVTEGDGSRGNDLLSELHPIKVIAFKVDPPSMASTAASSYNLLNRAMELHIGEREKIGQGTFGYKKYSIENRDIF